jgi:hypothetical protein
MTKTTEALRIELEDLKNLIYEQTADISALKEIARREKARTNRIVQVLLNNLPKERLDTVITFDGFDCHGEYRYWPYHAENTLRDFLLYLIDP